MMTRHPGTKTKLALTTLLKKTVMRVMTSLPNLTTGPCWLTMKKMMPCWKMSQALASLSKAMMRINCLADHAVPSR